MRMRVVLAQLSQCRVLPEQTPVLQRHQWRRLNVPLLPLHANEPRPDPLGFGRRQQQGN